MTIEDRSAFVELAVEYWKLFKLTERALVDTQIGNVMSISAQLRFSMSRLHAICAKGGLKLISYDRDTYEPNLPVTVANAEEAASFHAYPVDTQAYNW